ncbi:hypothetical protein GCM10020258_03280 [Sphingomonas yabuuchiae]
MANETDGRALDLDEADRLPWLETVEADEPEGVGIGKVIALVILGLAILAAIGFGFYKWQAHRAATDGDGAVIAAPEGDYKVRPADPGGLKIKGEGNTAIATSAGKPGGTGAIDLRAVPEAPMNGTRVVQKPAEPNGGRNAVAQVPDRAASSSPPHPWRRRVPRGGPERRCDGPAGRLSQRILGQCRLGPFLEALFLCRRAGQGGPAGRVERQDPVSPARECRVGQPGRRYLRPPARGG